MKYLEGTTPITIIRILLVVATFAVYCQILEHNFINYDDRDYVIENRHVLSGLTQNNIDWAFQSVYLSNWHPVTWLSHMLDVEVFGLEPSGHHLTSLIFHIANSLLLFSVFVKMTGAVWRSGLIAALFALHPLNVESVAWIAERKNLISTFFWFLTLLAYIDFVKKNNWSSYLLVVLFLTLGLMAKPMLVTLPFTLLLLDYWPLKRLGLKGLAPGIHRTVKPLRLVLEKIPFFIIVTVSSITTYTLSQNSGNLQSEDFSSLSFRIANALISYLEYLKKMVWPQGLTVFYPHLGNNVPIWKVMVCGLVLLGFTLWVVREFRRLPYLAVGWFWYLGTLVPVIGIVQAGVQAMADRYMYIPLVGIFIALAWGIEEVMKNAKKKKYLFFFVGALISTLMVLTWIQASYWENGVTLFRHSVDVSKSKDYRNASVHAFLGDAFHKSGELSSAISELAKSLELDEKNLFARNNLAAVYAEQGNFREALFYADELYRIAPQYIPGLVTLGRINEEMSRLEEARDYYIRALTLAPKSYKNNLNAANIFYRIGDMREAARHYKKAIALNKFSIEAYYNLGNSFGQLGQIIEAEQSFKKAILLDKNQPLSHYGLGLIYEMMGEYSKAKDSLEQAIILNPELKEARERLKKLHKKTDRRQ
jgi:protein O-mannosyl-transferase